ncbi:hypothetical protein ACQEU5_25015 [Marinactinospora thermotolerans]|uniref:hypothetical protein n=1 Tax=Marinactinospora thermotolerans TaxID=531310 RepID=UPI003D9433FE
MGEQQFTYRIERWVPDEYGPGVWRATKQGLLSGEDDPDALATRLLGEYLANPPDGAEGDWFRVLVWGGTDEGEQDPTLADAEERRQHQAAQKRPGRPPIGPPVKTHLSTEEVAQLQALADENGVTQAEMTRRILRDFLSQRVPHNEPFPSGYWLEVSDKEILDFLLRTDRYGLRGEFMDARVLFPRRTIAAAEHFPHDQDGVVYEFPDRQRVMFIAGDPYPLTPTERSPRPQVDDTNTPRYDYYQ